MKLSIKEVFLLSRPRFWMYVLGTFLVGMICSGNIFSYDQGTVLLLLAFGLFFTLPANVLIYGVNDIYDYQTDIYNEKKIAYESVLEKEKHQTLWVLILFLVVPFIVLSGFLNTPSQIALSVFIFSGIFYSATPIRAKGKPPLDILFSAIIYTSPGVIGFLISGNTNLDWVIVLGGLIWSFGMQTYSAVPDITADTKAGVRTMATLLGGKNALWFSLVCYIGSAALGYIYLGPIAIIFGGIYVITVLLSIYKTEKLFTFYTYFPVINIVVGTALFFYLFFQEVF